MNNDQNVKPDSSWYENGDRIIHVFYGPMIMKWFLDMLYKDTPVIAELAFQTKHFKQGHSFNIENKIYPVVTALEWAKNTDVFFCISLLDNSCGSINDQKSVKVVPCLWLNIRILCEINQGAGLPTQSQAYEFLKSQAVKPNFIVDTGSELQAYWLFKEPHIIEDDDDRDHMIKMIHEFQQKLIAAAKHHGWCIEDTSSIANLQRVPGTWNYAFTPPKPIKLLGYEYI